MMMVSTIKKILGKGIRIAYKLIYRFIPSDPNTILFISFHGRGYSDNPKALYEYLKHNSTYRNYTFVWAIKHHKKKKIDIPGAKVIEYFSIPYFFYLARSRFWIVNCKLPLYVLKKKEQIYLQTWHGTPLKRLAHDILVPEGTTFYRSHMSEEDMKKTYDNDVAKYTYMISPNQFCTEVFQSAFQIDRERLIETGYPRNDYLSNVTATEVKEIKQRLHLPMDKKIILYAPTWRDNQFSASGYTFALKVDFLAWKELLGEEYIVLFKPHYLITSTYAHEKELENFVYDMDAMFDISDLYVISDILVTDYSSVFFDFAILKRPIYFYMYDIDEYGEELRGFYLDIHKDLPGDLFREEKALLTAMKHQVYDAQRMEKFNRRFNNCEDGNASKRVIDLVFSNKR